MNSGKAIRLKRLFDMESKRTLIVPMDHGVTDGNIPGLASLPQAIRDMAEGGTDAILMHKGGFHISIKEGIHVGRILLLSASTHLSPQQQAKNLVASVEEALRLGADAVSLHVNLSNNEEQQMLSDMGRIADSCERWGMPLLAMLYAKGPNIADAYDPDVIGHCARVGMELGADIIKIPYTGDKKSFSDIISSCTVPIVIAGGPKTATLREFLTSVHEALEAGASGLSAGRNIFQYPGRIGLVQALKSMLKKGLSLEETIMLVEKYS